MQKVAIIGNLGRDAEIKYTQNGNAVMSMSIAAKSGYGEQATTVWWRGELWGKRVEKLKLSKGDKVYVYGDCVQEEYEGRDGVKKTNLKVRIQDLEILSPKRDGHGGDAPSDGGGYDRQYQPPQQSYDSLDNIPF